MPSQLLKRWPKVALLLLLLLSPHVNSQIVPQFSVRAINGSDSNEGGLAGSSLIRVAKADYPKDGSGADVADETVVNPRSISNACCKQDLLKDPVELPEGFRLTDMMWAWGQFLDHDIGLTPGDEAAGSASIPIEDEDDVMGSGNSIPFTRSMFNPATGSDRVPREHINLITPLIDGSMVYGSSEERAAALRTFEKGKLKHTMDMYFPNHFTMMPPLNTDGLENDNGHTAQEMFLFGDLRGNEQVGLTAMHTLLLREHNRLCSVILSHYPDSSDEQTYQLARKIVGAQIQKITYEEWLPILLGPRTVHLANTTYLPHVNVQLATEFSTAAFRFGHTMLSGDLRLISPRGGDMGTKSLRELFFNPDWLRQNARRVDLVLHGLLMQPAQAIDLFVVDDVRDFLFGNPGEGGLDLAALNIQRGRDHGVPKYNAVREAYGLQKRETFQQVTREPKLQDVLKETFGSPDNMDLWVGCLAENNAPNAYVGSLVAKILREQFTRLMRGDKYFYLNDPDLNSDWVKENIFNIDKFRFTDLIQWNTWNTLRNGRSAFQI